MDNLNLPELEQLCNAATPGPWHVVYTDDAHSMNAVCISTVDHGNAHTNTQLMGSASDPENMIACTLLQYPCLVAHRAEKWDDDAAFIAAARTAVPALIAENARLKEALIRATCPFEEPTNGIHTSPA